MPKIEIAKKLVSTVVSYGSGIIVYSIIRNNLPDDLPPHKQAAVAVASFAVGGMVADAASTYTDKLIDETVAAYIEVKEARK
jgi:hypothetical protein